MSLLAALVVLGDEVGAVGLRPRSARSPPSIEHEGAGLARNRGGGVEREGELLRTDGHASPESNARANVRGSHLNQALPRNFGQLAGPRHP